MQPEIKRGPSPSEAIGRRDDLRWLGYPERHLRKPKGKWKCKKRVSVSLRDGGWAKSAAAQTYKEIEEKMKIAPLPSEKGGHVLER